MCDHTLGANSTTTGPIYVTPTAIWTGPHSLPVTKTCPATGGNTTVPGTPPPSDVTAMGQKAAAPEAPEAPAYEQDPVLDERHPWTCDFGFKADPQEIERDGQVGLLCQGFASKYNEVDAVGEEQLPGAFRSFGEEWFAQKEPLVLYNHGMDPALGARPIGRGVSYKMLSDGVYVEVFVPRDQAEGWQDRRARRRFAEVYQGIKNGIIRGFSVGGAFTRFGKKLANWATVELSITPAPCLASATFALGSKAVIDRYGAVPFALGEDDPMGDKVDQDERGVISRKAWSSVMGFARAAKDHSLHDHLLSYAPEFQGKHDAEDCAICSDRRSMLGVKASQHKGDYLVAEGDNPSDWHLPVKENGKPNHRLMGAAWAALHGGYRGNKYEGPGKAEAIRKLKALYKSEGLDLPESGSGGKIMGLSRAEIRAAAGYDPLDASEVLSQAQAFLAEYGQAVKAGRRHSKETQAAVRYIVEHLQSFFGLTEDDEKGDA